MDSTSQGSVFEVSAGNSQRPMVSSEVPEKEPENAEKHTSRHAFPEAVSSPRVRPFRFKDSVDPEYTYKASTSSRHRRSRRYHRNRSLTPDIEERERDQHERSRARRRHHRDSAPKSWDRSRSPGPPPRELSPDSAFRESLFDAMADDEGAAYWEGVYGQPIHNFGPMPSQPKGEYYEGDDYTNPNVLDADAYAAFVRRKMWERSNQYVVQERMKREEERMRLENQIKQDREDARRRKEQERKARNGGGCAWDDDNGWRRPGAFNTDDNFTNKIDESLKRGEKRREEKRWREAWERYNACWIRVAVGGEETKTSKIPWPVLSGDSEDVNPESIRLFMEKAFAAAQKGADSDDLKMALRNQLKEERVRWHPDKIMQRFSSEINEETMKTVTAIFQIIDRMWRELNG